jgi:hypothetical protein
MDFSPKGATIYSRGPARKFAYELRLKIYKALSADHATVFK